jgi:hypothetical protein
MEVSKTKDFPTHFIGQVLGKHKIRGEREKERKKN